MGLKVKIIILFFKLDDFSVREGQNFRRGRDLCPSERFLLGRIKAPVDFAVKMSFSIEFC